MILYKEKCKKGADLTTENNSLMIKMVTSYSIFLLVILMLFGFLYLTTHNNMKNVYNLHNKSTFVSNVDLFEKDLDIMEVYCRQLLQTNSFRKVMSSEEVTLNVATLGNEVKTILATDVYPDALLPVDDIYCYIYKNDTILSPNYFVTQDQFYKWMKKYPAGLQEVWLNTLTDTASHYRFLDMHWLVPNSSKDYFMYIINLDDLYYMDAPAVVCFVVDKDELSERFECISDESMLDYLLVMDENGNVVLSLGDLTTSSNSVINLDYSSQFASYSRETTIGKYTSEVTGYTYYYSFPGFDHNNHLSNYQTLLLCIALLTVILGIFLILRFSRRNVKPIIELGHELHEAVEAQNHLQEVMDSQRPIMCRSYVRQLLSGSVTTEEEAAYISNYMELENEYAPCFNVLYAVVYNNFEDSQNGAPASDENVQDTLDNIIHTALQKFFGEKLYYYIPANRTYAILLPFSSSEEHDFILKTQSTVRQLHEYLLETYGIWFFAGLGKNTNSLMNVWESYQQAMEAVNYTTKNYIFLPYEMIKKDSNVFYYPPELSTKMIHFVTTGNKAQVMELFNLIHEENIEERSLPINLIKFLLSDIRNTLLKARFALPSTTDPEAVKVLDERFNEHLTFQLCEDLALTLCKLFDTKDENEALSTTIEKYIHANYKDPSLCLNKISDEFQISESYFSHMFKDKTGVNFSTYLENLRMAEAVKLIKETDISLNELYIAVGYNNPNTFRRAFKKIYGVTPSSMR